MKLKASASYYGSTPQISEIRVKMTAGEETDINAFEQGMTDVLVTNAMDVKLITILGIFGVISPLLFAFMLPMVYVNTKSLMNQDCSISRSFRQSYVEGSRNWGFIFATCFLAILCYFIVDFLACIPFYVIQLIYNIAVYGEIAYNDPVGLPTYFGVLTFFMAFFSSFVSPSPNFGCALFFTLLLFEETERISRFPGFFCLFLKPCTLFI